MLLPVYSCYDGSTPGTVTGLHQHCHHLKKKREAQHLTSHDQTNQTIATKREWVTPAVNTLLSSSEA